MKASSYYFDTSALVKRYIRETGSDGVETLLRKQRQIFTAGFTYCELYACFGRLQRLGLATREQIVGLSAALEKDWTQMTVVELTTEIRERIPKLCATCTLKGGDVVQLASALLAAEWRDGLVFVASDVQLLNAAKICKLPVIDPTA